MKTQKQDRRSLRTRELLSHALVELMQEKRYDTISVQDILDRANVGRSTFYAHYEDKEDLLISSLEKMIDQFIHHVEDNGQLIISSEAFFEHVKEHTHLYKAMVWGRGMDVLYNKGQSQLSRKIEAQLAAHLPDGYQPVIPLPVVAAFMSGAFLTMLKWWIEEKTPYTPKQMSEMFQSLAMFGSTAALNPRP